ncbi:hypothetical protein LguiA_033357 [Lonicera macranthoides]
MWRSVALARRAFLSKYLLISNPSQVLNCHILTSPKFSHHQSTRFLSDHSSLDSESPVFEISEKAKDFTDADNVFQEIPSRISSESEELSGTSDNTLGTDGFASGEEKSKANDFPYTHNVFDENPSRISLESEELIGTSETLEVDGFASGEDENVVEVEVQTHEVDLEELESVLSLLQSSGTVDGSIESSLEKMKLAPHEEFVVRVLETPLVPGENLIGFFKWVSKRPEFSVTTQSLYALVRAICSELKKKDAYAVWDLVKEVGENEIGVVNTEILNELISVFSRLGKGKAGFEVFNKFEELGCVPNSDTYYFTIEGLCRRSIFDWAVSVCEKMLNEGILPEKEKTGRIISLLCKGSKAKDAHSVYVSMKEKGTGKDKYPPQSSFNFLISSLCREDKTVHLALEMLEDISGADRKYAIMPFSYVIRGLCRINDVEGAKNLLYKMISSGPPPGNAVFNSVINSLSKAGEMEEALKMVTVMESRGLKPDVYTYSVIMSGYVKGGEMEKAREVLAEAKKKHSKLSPVTYHTLIRGYCKLEEFDKAVELLGEMKKYGVRPSADEYNKLIQSICLKNLDWGMAQKLLEEMQENGLHLNGITKGLINAVKELVEEGVETKEVTAEA